MLCQFLKERSRHDRRNSERLLGPCDWPVAKLSGRRGWPVINELINDSQDQRKFKHPGQSHVSDQVFRLKSIHGRLGRSRHHVLKIDVKRTEFDGVSEILDAGAD